MSQEKYILAFDQGTTSSRSIIFDHDGKVCAVAQKEFRQIYPKPGWVEHDPMEIWSSQSSTAAEAISRADLSADSIAAVGVTNQRETTIVWDKNTGKPVYNAIVWQDRRTADYCRKLKEEGIEAMVTEKTGLRLDPYFAGTKVRWILENVAGAREKAEAGKLLFGTVDSWLVWQLTGHKVHVTDITNASRTLFYNIELDGWDDELLELFDIPRSMLPEIKSCSEVYGHVEKNLYPGGAPIAGIAGDQHAALFGQACFEPGMAKNTYGTGCFLLMNMGEKPIRSKNNLLTTVAWRIGDKTEYALEGSIFIGGAVVQWIRDELQLVRTAQELDALAATVEDAGGLFLVPAFAGLGAPHWDPYARGAALGITRGTNRAHFCRAALESIAFQSADLITAMEKDSGISLKELRVDGGACQSDPLLQFQADLLQTEVIRPKCIETTALGAAYLAGLAVGFWKSRDSITKRWEQERSFEPQRKAEDMTALTAGWNKALERSKKWEDAVDE
ncbi:glycerol kinase GlpK [Coraliomargarita sp. SDUM461004]|uniref:Glycerol kinase n=1 Tax=Thalassobacterium sedimentorum TaxID=3041258 RepID=A0ABU1AFG8_9BACT|nr:glycerol kinase GlpK [Coraliomargarita sp. SDUM461004]MDQ8192858.1 glycerol kinase GlpK [Coraliomargarita sp. SDUM461004]